VFCAKRARSGNRTAKEKTKEVAKPAASEERWIRCGVTSCLGAARAFWWSKMILLSD